MNKRGFVSKILQNFRKPEGFFGRMILWGMNTGHASLAQWGMSCLQWQPEWSVLDIGCGGGANLLQILQRCPQGKAYGIDISSESVTFARKKNKKYLGTRCFIEQGGVHRLPYPDYAFDAVTAFETVYFWGNLQHAFTEVARVLKPGGSFLICCEISDPANKAWTGLVEGDSFQKWFYRYGHIPDEERRTVPGKPSANCAVVTNAGTLLPTNTLTMLMPVKVLSLLINSLLTSYL